MRYPSECLDGQVDQRLIKEVDGLICTMRQPKGKACDDLRIRIDVWIDDNPRAINESAAQIWGTPTPEGVVHDPANDPPLTHGVQVT